MKMLVVVALGLVAAVAAAPVEEPVAIVRTSVVTNADGSYINSFETANGIVVEEKGELKQVVDEENKPQTVLVKSGYYKYDDPQGVEVKIVYLADETGTHAEGDSIPKLPARR